MPLRTRCGTSRLPCMSLGVRAQGLGPRGGGTALALTICSVLPSVPYDAVGPPKFILLSRLNIQPARLPVNASPLLSRTTTHDSGPIWFATPSLGGTCTRETYRFVPAHRVVKKSPKRWMFVTLQRRLWYGIRGRKEKEYRAMTSNDEKKSTIPYVPYSTFSVALDYLASHGLPTKLDRSMFPSFSGTVQGQLIGAFGFLGLIDDAGIPQPALESLAIAEREERNTALRKILTARYEKLIEIDLRKITPAQFDDILGKYGVTGSTKTRAKSFFLKAAQEAGIEMSALLLRKTRSASPKKKNGARTKPNKTTPTAAKPAASGYSKFIHLPEAGGTLTLSGAFDPFALSDEERKLVFELTDLMTAFDRKTANVDLANFSEEDDQ